MRRHNHPRDARCGFLCPAHYTRSDWYMDDRENDWVDLYRDGSGETRWRYKAGNGEVLADSGEGYQNEGDALHALAIVTGRVPTVSETKGAPLPGPGSIRVVRRSGV